MFCKGQSRRRYSLCNTLISHLIHTEKGISSLKFTLVKKKKPNLLQEHFSTWFPHKNPPNTDWMAAIFIPFFSGRGRRLVSRAHPRLVGFWFLVFFRISWGVWLSDSSHVVFQNLRWVSHFEKMREDDGLHLHVQSEWHFDNVWNAEWNENRSRTQSAKGIISGVETSTDGVDFNLRNEKENNTTTSRTCYDTSVPSTLKILQIYSNIHMKAA